MKRRAWHLLCAAGLGDAQVAHHLEPLTLVDGVEKIWLIRHRPLLTALPKVHTIVVNPRKPQRFLEIERVCRRLACKVPLTAMVSFNPYPYGLLAYYATRAHRLPVHFGFIGSDWYRRPLLKKQLLPVIQRASLVTATGQGMRREMMAEGLSADRVEILPHSIDLERFPPATSASPTYDAIFVGALIEVKGVELILDSWSEVVKLRPGCRLCVVGDGPLRRKLEKKAEILGIAHLVDFVGYQEDVSAWLRKARLFVMASFSEGLPFALIEAMASGLVPVCTDVGTISDTIVPEVNGMLYAPGDRRALTAAVVDLLSSSSRLRTLRDKALAIRQTHSHDRVAAQWERWLERVGHPDGWS